LAELRGVPFVGTLGSFIMSSSKRTKPNILITGTPGVGKTATAILIADSLDMKHINTSEIIEQNKFYDGFDDELNSHILNEDKLLDALELMIAEANEEEEKGIVIDYHACEIFPERWFDLVLVLRTRTDVLYDRLVQRGYNEKKRNQNMECEIMQVVLDEAKESYAKEVVHEVNSNTLQDMDESLARVNDWVKQWVVDNT